MLPCMQACAHLPTMEAKIFPAWEVPTRGRIESGMDHPPRPGYRRDRPAAVRSSRYRPGCGLTKPVPAGWPALDRTVEVPAAAAGGADTPHTGLIKHLVATERRTRRAVRLLFAAAAVTMMLLAVIAVVATVMGPMIAAFTGGVPLVSAAVTTTLGVATRRRRSARDAPRSSGKTPYPD